MPERRLLAAVDLGSNSFRLLIGRVEQNQLGDQVFPIDSLKESVRLAAGLTKEGKLDADSQRRALEALHRFGERLRSFSPDAVRAVATNTLRVARNARSVLSTAEAALGFPIQVIAGHEEARLIYLGAAHALASDDQFRLVVDIGGGSTECIIGRNYESVRLESVGVGCVSLSQQFFPGGVVEAENFAHACYTARAVLAPITLAYRNHGWKYAVGTSGTAKALVQAAQMNYSSEELNREHLQRMADLLIKAGHADRIRLEGLKPERRPVFAGGLAVMTAVFDELGVESLRYCNGALRQGVLYDLLGRSAGTDMRDITVAQMIARYGADAPQGDRVAATSLALFGQVIRGAQEDVQRRRQMLAWAARLGEIGMSISHEDFHKHSAYVLANADMPGFTRDEQTQLSNLAFAQTGGLRKLKPLISDERDWLMVLSLRLANILHRRRDNDAAMLPALFFKRGKVRIEVPRVWADAHPLSDESLLAETAGWREVAVFDEIGYQRI